MEKALAAGKLKGAEKLLKVELEKQNRAKFDKELREEYEGIYPEYRAMTDDERDAHDTDEDSNTIEREEGYEYPEVKIEYIAEDGTRTPAEYLTYQEWSTVKATRAETYQEYTDEGGELAEADFDDAEQYTKKLVDTEELVRPYTPLTVDELVAGVEGYGPLTNKKKEVELAKVNKQAESMLTEYPQYERDSWDIQEAEAVAYKADDTVATPLIDGIVAARGCDKAELVDKILEKASLFKAAIGYTIGNRQKVAG